MEKRQDRPIAGSMLFCMLAALLLALPRVVLRMDFIDSATGFYTGYTPFIPLFYTAYFLVLCAFLFLAYYPPLPEPAAARPDRPAAAAALLLGTCTLLQAVCQAWLERRRPAVRVADLFLRWGALVFALAAGLVFFILAYEIWNGKPLRSAASGALTLTVLHRCFLLLGGFTSRIVSSAVSGALLETLLLVLGVLFVIAHARVLSGIKRKAGLRLLLFSGYGYAVTCVALYLPEVIASLTGHTALSTTEATQLAISLSTAIYALVFIARVSPPTAPAPCKHRRG